MSKKEKLLTRLLLRPKDFSYAELKSLLNGLSYEEFHKGKTSGSRVAFVNNKTNHIIRLHKPHPKNILKSYQVDLIIEELKKENLL
ncbi:MAG: type II toxin-antitoxin system HicA family toxin [Bacteroidota bacterium]|nr:type II toxin-antitoxin system HicA family toxin [Bacteroidota bacterium]